MLFIFRVPWISWLIHVIYGSLNLVVREENVCMKYEDRPNRMLKVSIFHWNPLLLARISWEIFLCSIPDVFTPGINLYDIFAKVFVFGITKKCWKTKKLGRFYDFKNIFYIFHDFHEFPTITQWESYWESMKIVKISKIFLKS